MDYLIKSIKNQFPSKWTELKSICPETENLLEKFVAAPDLDLFNNIPIKFGTLHLMFYQSLIIYQCMWGKMSPEHKISLSIKNLDQVASSSSIRSLNVLKTMKNVIVAPARPIFFWNRPIVLNLPTGCGKTITSILTSCVAMCDFDFHRKMMEPKNLKNWFNDFHNCVPGSFMNIGINLDNIQVKLVPLTVINVHSGALFNQWFDILSSGIDDIAQFCQDFILKKYGLSKRIVVTIFPKKSDGKLSMKLKDFSHLYNQEYSDKLEVVFVITSVSTFQNFIEKKNEVFPAIKKRKFDDMEPLEEEHRQVICPVAFIVDEPQTSKTVDRYSIVKAPLRLYLSANISAMLNRNTALSKSLRSGGTAPVFSLNTEQQIVNERNVIVHLFETSLLSEHFLELSVFEAVTKGQMSKSIWTIRTDLHQFYTKLPQPPKEPTFLFNDRIQGQYYLSMFLVSII